MASGDARPIAIKGVAYRVTFPIWDADGDLVTGAAGLDSEVSKDGGTFADCTNEATEIATGSGIYYLDLTATEMNADTVAIIVKTTTSGAKTTAIVLLPVDSGDIVGNALRIGMAQAGTSSTIILDAGASSIDNFYEGTLVMIVAGTGAGQSRIIRAYTGSSKGATITPAWDTTPGSTSVFAIIPAHANLETWLGDTPNALVASRVDVSVGAMAANVLTAAAIAADAITAAKIEAGALDADAFATNAIGALELAADAVAEIVAAMAAPPTATAIADAVLSRPISSVEPGSFRTLYGALASLVNRTRINGTNLEIYASDDTTLLAVIPATMDAALVPIKELNPP